MLGLLAMLGCLEGWNDLVMMVIVGGFCPGDCWELEMLMRSYSFANFHGSNRLHDETAFGVR